MADDYAKENPDADPILDVNSESDLSYWSDKLGLPTDRLKVLAQEVGPKIQDIQRVIGKYTPTGNPR